MKEEILVIIPHSSRKRPREIRKEWLSKNQRYLLYSETSETDRYSELLYNFGKIINNKQALFPISKVYLNVCRNPNDLDETFPLKIVNKEVYLDNEIPSEAFRRKLIKKYTVPFYKEISKFKGDLILNAHTTISGHSSLKEEELNHQIIISNIQKQAGIIRKFAPDTLIKIYVEELEKRLPNIKIGINSVYVDIYDYFCDKFGWNNGKGIPIIHQETDEGLYIKNNKLDKKELSKLRKAFASALVETVKRYKE